MGKYHILFLFIAGWAAQAASVPCAFAADTKEPTYEMIDLGFLACPPGNTCDSSETAAINETGSIAGSIEVPGCFHAAIHRDGEWVEIGALGIPPGLTTAQSSAKDVNNRNQVVGSSLTSNTPPPDQSFVYRAFLWDEEGGMRDLGAFGAYVQCDQQQNCTTYDFSAAVAINDRGQVVGTSTSPQSPGRAFLWEKGVMSDLGALPGAYLAQSEATDINNRGEIVGTSGARAFIYKNGVMKDLDKKLPFSQPITINDAGEVLLWIGGDSYLWHKGAMKLLEPLAGDLFAQAFSMNNRGQVAGISVGCGEESCTFSPVLWEGDAIIELGGLEGAYYNQPTGINNRGEIAGVSYFPEPSYITRGFLAEPH